MSDNHPDISSMNVLISVADLNSLRWRAEQYEVMRAQLNRKNLAEMDHAEWKAWADAGHTVDAIKALRKLIGCSLTYASKVCYHYKETGRVEFPERA